MQADTKLLKARPWLLGLYPLALLLFLQPFIEALGATWPVRAAEVWWRFAFTGVFYTMLPTLLVALLIAAGAAYLLRHRVTLRVVGVISIVFSIAIVLLTASFALDAIQMRRLVRPEALGGFDRAAIKALVTAVLASLAGVVLGVGAFRSSRRSAAQALPRRRTAGEGLLVGQPPKADRRS